MGQHIGHVIRARKALARAAGLRVRRRKIPRQNPPTGARTRYQSFLTRLRKDLENLLKAELYPALPRLVREADFERGGVRRDASVEELQTLFARLRVLFVKMHPLQATTEVLRGVALDVDRKQAEEHQRQVKAAVGIEIVMPEPWRTPVLDGFIAQNQDLVTSLVDDQLTAFKNITSAGLRSGLRVESIQQELEAKLDVSKSRAALLARDQTLKLFGEMAELRQKSVGVEEYDWDTSKDERVRPAHAALDGTRQSWADPPIVDPRTGRRAHPGLDYQCRCQAIPVIPDDFLQG